MGVCTRAFTGVALIVAAVALANVVIQPRVRGPYTGYLPHCMTDTKPCVSAHRGSRYYNPENSIQAHRSALDLGADILETDIRKSKDGELFMFHDHDLTRTMGINRTIEDLTAAEIRELDAAYLYTPDLGKSFPERGAGHVIPTFREFLAAFADSGTFMNLEIKEDDDTIVADMLSELAGYPALVDRVIFASRYCGPVEYVRKHAPQYATGSCEVEGIVFVFLSELYLAVPWFSTFGTYNGQVLQVPVQSGAIKLATPRLVSHANSIGVQVHYWVVNHDDTIAAAIDAGANGLITDLPDKARAELAARSLRPLPPAVAAPTKRHSPQQVLTELHTCVSTVCLVLRVAPAPVLAVALLFVIALVLSWLAEVLCCGRGRRGSGKAHGD